VIDEVAYRRQLTMRPTPRRS